VVAKRYTELREGACAVPANTPKRGTLHALEARLPGVSDTRKAEPTGCARKTRPESPRER